MTAQTRFSFTSADVEQWRRFHERYCGGGVESSVKGALIVLRCRACGSTLFVPTEGVNDE